MRESTEYAKLIDISKCVGCRACEVACKEWNETGCDEITERPFGYQSHHDLTYRTWNIVKFFERDHSPKHWHHPEHTQVGDAAFIAQYETLLGPEPDEIDINNAPPTAGGEYLPQWLFRKHGCMHCKDAACVKACPVDALTRNDQLGYVRLNVASCTGCGYCVDACPFDVPQLGAGAVLGFGKVSKCRLCSDRIQHGMQPACVQSCPPNALEFGRREEMVALGHQRIDDLKSRGYQDANLYGETELGGLNVLTVLPGRPHEFDLPEDPQVPAYLTTWKEVVKPLGALAIGGTALALGFGILNSLFRIKKGDSHAGHTP